MILTGNEISKQVKKGTIYLKPYSSKLLNPNSYNYRLGDTLLQLCDKVIDTKKKQIAKEIKIPKSGYILQPNITYLGSTLESIGSDKFVPTLTGRSSVARLGLFLQVNADLGHLGTNHCWTLELVCVQPIKVYPRMKIGQIAFWKPTGVASVKNNYKSKKDCYSNFSMPQLSITNKFYN